MQVRSIIRPFHLYIWLVSQAFDSVVILARKQTMLLASTTHWLCICHPWSVSTMKYMAREQWLMTWTVLFPTGSMNDSESGSGNVSESTGTWCKVVLTRSEWLFTIYKKHKLLFPMGAIHTLNLHIVLLLTFMQHAFMIYILLGKYSILRNLN